MTFSYRKPDIRVPLSKSSFLRYEDYECGVYDDIMNFNRYYTSEIPPRNIRYRPDYPIYSIDDDMYGYYEIVSSYGESKPYKPGIVGNMIPRDFFMDIDDDNLCPADEAIENKLLSTYPYLKLSAIKYAMIYMNSLWDDTIWWFFAVEPSDYYLYLAYNYDIICEQVRDAINRALCRRMLINFKTK